jgi:hypothetical protein
MNLRNLMFSKAEQLRAHLLQARALPEDDRAGWRELVSKQLASLVDQY